MLIYYLSSIDNSNLNICQGKDALLYAIAALCRSCHIAIASGDPSAPNAILNVVTSSCTKKLKKYREVAFSCLEEVIYEVLA